MRKIDAVVRRQSHKWIGHRLIFVASFHSWDGYLTLYYLNSLTMGFLLLKWKRLLASLFYDYRMLKSALEYACDSSEDNEGSIGEWFSTLSMEQKVRGSNPDRG